MRLFFVSLVPASVLVSLTLLAGPARAHLDLLSPPPRTNQLKQGPCGAGPGDPRGPTVATYKPGEKIIVTWNEYVDHPGHYRIALDPDGQDDFFEPATFDDISGGPGVIMDGIPDKNGGDYSQEITLPDIECDNCVLQVIQMMTDKKPYGDGNDLYYQCADIAIVGEAGATSGDTSTTDPGTTPVPGTTGAESSSAGETGGATTGGPGSEGGETAAGSTGGDTATTASTAASTTDDPTGSATATGGATADGTGTGGGTSDGADGDKGCGCRGEAGGAGWLGLALLPLLLRRRRA